MIAGKCKRPVAFASKCFYVHRFFEYLVEIYGGGYKKWIDNIYLLQPFHYSDTLHQMLWYAFSWVWDAKKITIYVI